MRHMEETPIAQVPTMESWTENFALAAFDPKAGIDVFLHVGRWLKNTDLWREIVTIALPDGSVITHRGIGNACADALGPGGGNLRVRVREPYRRLWWSFLGAGRRVPAANLMNGELASEVMEPFRFDLEFSSDLPVWDLGHVGDNTEFMGRGHIEQLGKIVGSIRFGDASYEFDAWGNRDHSRGPRVVDDMKRHIWMHGSFGDDLGFLCYDAETYKSGVAYSEACVYDQGMLHKADLQLGYRVAANDDPAALRHPVPFEIRYGARTLKVVADSFDTIMAYHFTSPWDFFIGRRIGVPGTRGSIEQGVRFTLDGQTQGYGHMERSLPREQLSASR